MKCCGKLGFARFLLSSHRLHMRYQYNPETLLPPLSDQIAVTKYSFRLATQKEEHIVSSTLFHPLLKAPRTPSETTLMFQITY